jgi:hypothetical protein
VPIVKFCEFQELEARNEDTLAKTHIRRGDAGVGMDIAHHLGGRLGHIMCSMGKWHILVLVPRYRPEKNFG